MSKLPNLTESTQLEKLIREKPAEIIHNDAFRALVVENVRKMPEETRETLMQLMRTSTMNQNG